MTSTFSTVKTPRAPINNNSCEPALCNENAAGTFLPSSLPATQERSSTEDGQTPLNFVIDAKNAMQLLSIDYTVI